MRLKMIDVRTCEVLVHSSNMDLSKCISMIEANNKIKLDNIWVNKDANGKLKLNIKCDNILYQICG